MTLRSLCDFAVKRRWLRNNPAANVKLASIRSDGFHTWSDEEIARFEAHHPVLGAQVARRARLAAA